MENAISSWIEHEFSSLSFGDVRLLKRFKMVVDQFMKKAQSNICSTFSSWPSIKGCYRLLDNNKVDESEILRSHVSNTLKRIENSSGPVLILHDTTYLDFKNRQKTNGLDRVFTSGAGKLGTLGLMLHNSFAVDSKGLPLGLVNQFFIERQSINTEKRANKVRYKKPTHEKESIRWIKSVENFNQLNCNKREIIHIADREGDFYELYRDISHIGEKFLVRACHNRAINKTKRREKPKDKMFDYFCSLPISGSVEIDIQCNGDKKYRKASLSLSFGNFTLPPPPSRTKNKDGVVLENVDLYGVFVNEKHPPKDCDALQWLLITNMSITSLEDAVEKMQWYTKRWEIELFHKILKSGCSVESAQLRTRERLIKYITMKSIVAWRLFWLSRSFTSNSDVSCEDVLSKVEQNILFRRFNQGAILNTSLPAKQAFIWIAKLGGYVGRKNDPPPGMISIWRGWTRFMDMVDDHLHICG